MGLADLGEENLWQGEEEACQPDDCTGDVDREEAAVAVGMDGMDDGQVAVHSNAGQEKATAVEVDLVQSNHSFAEEGAQDPAHRALSHSEGQDEDQQEVSHRQMEQKGLSGAARLPVPLQDHQHQDVAHHTQEEDEAISYGHEYGLKGGQKRPLDCGADVIFHWGCLRAVSVVT